MLLKGISMIGFLISKLPRSAPKIIPIEIESGKNYVGMFLEKFVGKCKKRIAVACIVRPKQLFLRYDGIICLPPYKTFRLQERVLAKAKHLIQSISIRQLKY